MPDMSDLTSTINNILNSPEGMQQLQNMASALGLGNMMGGQPNNQPLPPSPPPPIFNQQNQQQSNQFQNSQPAQTPADLSSSSSNSSGGLNIESLMGMLQNMGLGGQNNSPQAPMNSAPALPNIDFNTIVKIQQAMSAFTAGNKNVDLLRSLKPHLSEVRAKKVDDAIRIMQLINMLPLIKQSGIFGLGGDTR